MLSKFQTKEKTGPKNLSRNAVASVLARDVDRRHEIPSSSDSCRVENFLQDRRKKVKWHVNPLYKVKSNNMEDSESESVASLSSRQSYPHSELSVDSGYKSNTEEGNGFQNNFSGKNPEVNFREAASELLNAMKALGAEEEVNASVEKALEDCEHELEKLDSVNPPDFSLFPDL